MKPNSHLYPISIRKYQKLEFKVLVNEKIYIEVSWKTFSKRPRGEFSQSPQYFCKILEVKLLPIVSYTHSKAHNKKSGKYRVI